MAAALERAATADAERAAAAAVGTVETTKQTRVAGAGRVRTKTRVAAAWLGDKKTAQRDINELRNGDQR